MESITVLIIAHKRKKFLKYAVLSAQSQSEITGNTEIIVVKNFSDLNTDNFLKERKVISYLSDDEGLGAKVSSGIQKSTGEIICFLEDDDVFLKNKLKRVTEVMSDPTIGYYHNNFEVINEEGQVMLNPLTVSSNVIDRKVDIYSVPVKMYNELIGQGATFNLSCVTIRKSVVIQYLGMLEQLNTAVENFLFYIALDSGFRVVVDSYKTTQYRIHNDNFSISIQYNLENFQLNKEKFLQYDIKAYNVILSSITNENIRRHVQYRAKFPIIAIYILNHAPSTRYSLDRVNTTFEAIRNHSILLVVLVIISFLTRFFPKLGKFIYYRYDRHIYNRMVRGTSKRYHPFPATTPKS